MKHAIRASVAILMMWGGTAPGQQSREMPPLPSYYPQVGRDDPIRPVAHFATVSDEDGRYSILGPREGSISASTVTNRQVVMQVTDQGAAPQHQPVAYPKWLPWGRLRGLVTVGCRATRLFDRQ